jgi:hypothetical protein
MHKIGPLYLFGRHFRLHNQLHEHRGVVLFKTRGQQRRREVTAISREDHMQADERHQVHPYQLFYQRQRSHAPSQRVMLCNSIMKQLRFGFHMFINFYN